MGPGTVAMIDLRLPTGSPTTSTTRLPPSALSSPPFPPSGPQSAPNPPGGRPARRAERRRRTRGRWAVAPPASVSRNVDAAAPRLRMLCPLRRQPVGVLKRRN